MSAKRDRLASFLLAGLLLGSLLLTACELHPRTARVCEWGEVPMIHMTAPANYSIIDDLTPNITWAHEESGCVPAEYRVDLWSAMNYPVGASAGYFLFSKTTTVEHLDWPASAPSLEPGHSYYVYVTSLTYRDGVLTPGPDTFGYFSTGPICPASASLSAPNLRWPPDGWKLDPTAEMDFEWSGSTRCWPDHNYFIEFATTADFARPILQMPDFPLEHVWLFSFMDIGWETCTRYYWHVRPDSLAGEGEPFSETRSFVIQPGDTTCPPEPSGSRVPVPAPVVHLTVTANCRSGPGMDYPVLDILDQGVSVPVVGRNQESSWWQVASPNLQLDCWLSGNVIELSGEAADVPVVTVAPPPVAVPSDTPVPPVNCGQYTSNTCSSNPACTWKSGACVNK